jgi:hypothetical protein
VAGEPSQRDRATRPRGPLTAAGGAREPEAVFAIFDLSDSILDSYVFLDDFRWGCEGGGMPKTRPEG